jgi:hypothetical protein
MADLATILDTIDVAQQQPAVTANELFDAVSQGSIFGRRARTSNALTWGYYGGRYRRQSIASGTLALTANQSDIYIVAAKATGVVSFSTATTNWNDPAYERLYWVATNASAVSDYEDHREVAFPERWAVYSYSAAHTTLIYEANSVLLHPSADTTPRTFTIDSNANVPYPIGTEIEFINETGAGTLTIAITSDTLTLSGAGSTGSRTLAADGRASARKVTSTHWYITNLGGLT